MTGRFAAAGELASTILAPGQVGYHPYDLYPTPDGRGDPNKRRPCWPRPATLTG